MLKSCLRTARLFAVLSCFQAAITGCSRINLEASRTSLPSPAPLRLLATAIQSRDAATGSPALLQALADLGTAVNSGKSVGTAIQEFLKREGIPAAGQEPLRQTLLAN